jgi:hypothetical protein
VNEEKEKEKEKGKQKGKETCSQRRECLFEG